jgi:hypothetical protein
VARAILAIGTVVLATSTIVEIVLHILR